MTLLRGPRSERLVALSFVGLAATAGAWLLTLVDGVEQVQVVRAGQLSHFCALRAGAGAIVRPTPGRIRDLDGLFEGHSVAWVDTDYGMVLELRSQSASEVRE